LPRNNTGAMRLFHRYARKNPAFEVGDGAQRRIAGNLISIRMISWLCRSGNACSRVRRFDFQTANLRYASAISRREAPEL
jgi:hypothetical protein